MTVIHYSDENINNNNKNTPPVICNIRYVPRLICMPGFFVWFKIHQMTVVPENNLSIGSRHYASVDITASYLSIISIALPLRNS